MKKTKVNLIIFIIVTLASGWIGALLDMVLTDQPEGDSLGMGLWLVLPLLTAIMLRIISRDWKSAGLLPMLKANIKWYLISLAVFPAVCFVSLFLARLFGKVDLSKIDFNVILPLMATGLIVQLVKNIFEEFAWRGFLTPKLIELKANDWLLYLISGLVWALWHVPYYLVFLGDGVFEFLSVSRFGFIFISTMTMLCWNVLFVEMFRLAKSVWPCILMHAVEDGVVMFLFAGGYYTFASAGERWIFDPHVGIIATVLILGTGLLLRFFRVIKVEKEQENIILEG